MATRNASIDDLPRIVELFGELRASPINVDTLNNQFPRMLEDGRAVILALDESENIVGVAVVNLVYKLPKTECRLDEVIVADSARGHGYGSILVKACEAWAWQNGADVMEFTSRPQREAANGLYRKLGFELRDTNVYVKKRMT